VLVPEAFTFAASLYNRRAARLFDAAAQRGCSIRERDERRRYICLRVNIDIVIRWCDPRKSRELSRIGRAFNFFLQHHPSPFRHPQCSRAGRPQRRFLVSAALSSLKQSGFDRLGFSSRPETWSFPLSSSVPPPDSAARNHHLALPQTKPGRWITQGIRALGSH
jgi:hypothetical protein